MPITPLHFGLIPLINRITKRRMSVGGFILANCIADIQVLLQVYQEKIQELGGPKMIGTLHDVLTHNFAGALAVGITLGVLRFKSSQWWLGCILGSLTHVSLDMFVHTDVQPFSPWSTANPFYFGSAHEILSIILVIGLAVWLLELWDSRKKRQRS
jgi:membrane-bound metal-dependent hydrolase YbcI (DUF457 family)